jgi:hypothetical protein
MTPRLVPQVERRRPRSYEVKWGREVFRLECAILGGGGVYRRIYRRVRVVLVVLRAGLDETECVFRK